MRNRETSEQNYVTGYETTLIVRPDITEEGMLNLQEKLKTVIASQGGELVLTEDWGKRKMAYPIQNETRAHYLYMVYSGRGDIVAEMERNLRIQEAVIRFLSVQLQTEFSGEAFKKRRTEVIAIAKRREEEREARREERRLEREHSRDE